jgi:CheY-like chemotaxis protein
MSDAGLQFAMNKPLVLAVDDDRTLRMMLVSMLEALGYAVQEAQNGRQALDIILERKDEIDAILLDREMPVMTGLELIKHIKDNSELSELPIIMQTGSDSPENIKEGIDAGVFYYLTKPVNKEVLKSVLSAAIRESAQRRERAGALKKHQVSFNLIETCRFRFKTLSEAEYLASFLANCLPDAGRSVSGLAELLINAVEHGNLGITYAEKSQLIAEDGWIEEVERRLRDAKYKDRQVTATYRRRDEGWYITIADQGAGFDWKNYLYLDPARATDGHGRGIALANAMSFDRLSYNERGNEVTAFVGRDSSGTQ